MSDVVVIGAGSIGQAIARRVSAGKHVLLADLRQENADAAAEVLADAGFETSTAAVDVSLRESVLALIGQAATVDIEGTPGTTQPGSAITAIIFPASVAGSKATSFTTPGVSFMWDRRPPRAGTL